MSRRAKFALGSSLGLILCVSLTACSPMAMRTVPSSPVTASDATTFHFDSTRTGWNASETILAPASLSAGRFGALWNSQPLDSVTLAATTYAPHLYASPLYVDKVQITTGPYAGSQLSLVFAATSNNFVYAINAFDVSGPPAVPAGTIVWRRSLGQPTDFGLDGGVALGILGTPVIDLKRTPATLYVAADAVTETARDWKVFAVDLGSGNVLPGWPVTINDSTVSPINQNGPAKFQLATYMSQRGALNLSPDGKLVYVPFGGYVDTAPGWIVAVDTGSAAIASAFSAAPSTLGTANGGIWGSGGAAVDAAGNVYATTGNSPDGSADSAGVWGESLLVWSTGSPLRLRGTYTPWNYCQADHSDSDVGASSPMLLPGLDSTSTGTPNLVSFGGKQGTLYLVDRDHLPGRTDHRPACSTTPATDASLNPPTGATYYQGLAGPLSVFGPYSETCTQGDLARMRTTPAYFRTADGTRYIFVSGATKQSECSRIPVPPGLARIRIVTRPSQPAYLAMDGTDTAMSLFSPGPPVITSDGSANAIAWVLDANVYRSASLAASDAPHPVLYAVDANTMQVLWHSAPSDLNVGGKYNHPVIAHGVVFVGTDRIQAFGLTASVP